MVKRNDARAKHALRITAVACAVLAGCGSGDKSSGTESGTPASGGRGSNEDLVFYTVNNGCAADPFWAAVDNGAQDAAKALGVTVRIARPRNCESQAEENNLLTSVINNKPDGIALSVTSDTAFSSNIKRAREAGIPIIAYNSIPPDNDETKNPVQAFVGTDLYQSGVLWADEAIAKHGLSGGDKVAIVNVCAENIACDTIVRGWKSKADAIGAKSENVVVGQAVGQATSVVSAYLQRNQDVDIVLSMGAADAAVEGLKKAGKKPGDIPLAGYNLNGKMPQYMLEGWMQYTINQLPYRQGFDSITNLYVTATAQQPPANIQTGPVVLRASDKDLLTKELVDKTGY